MSTRAPADRRLLAAGLVGLLLALCAGAMLAMAGMLSDVDAFTTNLVGALLCVGAAVACGIALEIGLRDLPRDNPHNARGWRLLQVAAALGALALVWVLLRTQL